MGWFDKLIGREHKERMQAAALESQERQEMSE